jgi:hypothetical protein
MGSDGGGRFASTTIAAAVSFGVLIGIGITTVVVAVTCRRPPEAKEESQATKRPPLPPSDKGWELQTIGVVR